MDGENTVMENPIFQWDDFGGKPTISGNTHVFAFLRCFPVFQMSQTADLWTVHAGSNFNGALRAGTVLQWCHWEVTVLIRINMPYRDDEFRKGGTTRYKRGGVGPLKMAEHKFNW